MIEVLVEKHDEPKKKTLPKKYIFNCDYCGSIISVDEDNIDIDGYCGDIEEWVQCPVCLRREYLGLGWRISHAEKIYKLFHKIQ